MPAASAAGEAIRRSPAPDAQANTAPINDAPVMNPRLRDRFSNPDKAPRWSAPAHCMTALLFAAWNNA
ncbi:hypothetical protein G6F64_015213 [Rhizopus arrhizus]|uniref:Uncharacterized protein n=1 Tax=Rhizopus oryzae TaxID=64495 RepID=A0A9P7BJ20_RHIOR|nr:hypothetical protein G6F64_015213 [Rhizopus arrhizus]KAG1386985.1 hypothetical protein G6F58_013729 [Rhizopus delemar]